MGIWLVGSCEVDFVYVTEYVSEMETGKGFCVEAEGVERIVGGSEVALDEALVFVYLRKLHQSRLFYYLSPLTPTVTPKPTLFYHIKCK